jgi:hypothetical protein
MSAKDTSNLEIPRVLLTIGISVTQQHSRNGIRRVHNLSIPRRLKAASGAEGKDGFPAAIHLSKQGSAEAS